MSYTYLVECFFEDVTCRVVVYTGTSFFQALAAYRKARRGGGKYFLLEYRP